MSSLLAVHGSGGREEYAVTLIGKCGNFSVRLGACTSPKRGFPSIGDPKPHPRKCQVKTLGRASSRLGVSRVRIAREP